MSEDTKISKAELLSRIDKSWETFQAYLNTLTEEQLTIPTDHVGWTGKDHLTHLLVWEDGILGMFEGKDRREHMGVEAETWKTRDFDKINADIQQRYKDMPVSEVLQKHREVHQALLNKLEAMSDEDLMRPYSYYQPGSTVDRPVIEWITGDTYGHYGEHQQWIDAFVNKSDV